MSQINLVNFAGGVATADTANTANTIVSRDGSGNIAGAQLSGSELKSTGALTLTRSAKSATFTADANATYYSCDATGGAIIANLPVASTCAGRVYSVKKTDSGGNAVTITPNSGASDLIDGASTKALSSQFKCVICISTGSAWEILASF